MFKLYLIDKNELKKGEREEAEEHGFAPEVAHRTALDHLEKKDPEYYTKLAQYGLEEEGLEEEQIEEYKTGFGSGKMGDSRHAQGIPSGPNFPFDSKKVTGGRTGRIKRAAEKSPVLSLGAGFGESKSIKIKD